MERGKCLDRFLILQGGRRCVCKARRRKSWVPGSGSGDFWRRRNHPLLSTSNQVSMRERTDGCGSCILLLFFFFLSKPKKPESQFMEIMTNGNGLSVFMASMVNCGPCRVMDPKFRLFAEAYPDATFFKITGDTNDDTKALLKDLRVSAVPAFRVFNDGKDVSAELALMEQMDIIQAEKTLRLVVKRHYPDK
uniref:Thioredoxin domain-containing protein n=1 Tax=Lotharella globosa TaxID=91324 RepID=A0A7S4DZ61_9EUKA